MSANFHKIVDLTTVANLRTLAERMTHDERELDLEWIRERQWVVAPMDGERLFEDEARLLSSAIMNDGWKDCVSIATNLGITEHVSPAYELESTPGAIAAVNWDYVGLDHLFTTSTGEFAVLCADDYRLYGGSREFVVRATGKSVEATRREFLEAYSDSQESYSMQRAYEDILVRYEAFK